MLVNSRVIFKDNTVLNDISVAQNDYHSGTSTLAIVALEDNIYIGSDLPWNHRYVDVSSPNAATSTMSAKIWTGSVWEDVVDFVDQTKTTAGVTLSGSGIISFAPDRNGSGWSREETTEDISDLSTLKIYNLYWAKLSFSANLTGTTALRYIGHKFSTDGELGAYYPELVLTATKTQFESGKTDWSAQHVLAAEEVVADLRRKVETSYNFRSPNQILGWEMFSKPSIHQVAMIIWRAFGDAYKDNFLDAEKEYYKTLNRLFNGMLIDRDLDGRVAVSERAPVAGFRRV